MAALNTGNFAAPARRTARRDSLFHQVLKQRGFRDGLAGLVGPLKTFIIGESLLARLAKPYCVGFARTRRIRGNRNVPTCFFRHEIVHVPVGSFQMLTDMLRRAAIIFWPRVEPDRHRPRLPNPFSESGRPSASGEAAACPEGY